jgi:hypothetical protein
MMKLRVHVWMEEKQGNFFFLFELKRREDLFNGKEESHQKKPVNPTEIEFGLFLICH